MRKLLLLRQITRTPPGAIGATLSAVVVLSAVFAPLLAPYDPLAFHYDHVFAPPGGAFPLGTDNFGRDILSRVIWGSRISLVVALGAVLVGQVGGGVLGLITGYVGGRFDLIGQRVVDTVMVFPSLVLALVIVAIVGGSLTNVAIVIGIAQAPGAIRTIRSAALGAKATQYVEAAKSVGCSDARVMLRHVWPNCTVPLIVLASASIGHAILTEASLSFLGLGTPPPHPSWGAMMSGDGRTYLQRAPWIAVAPGIAVTLAVLGFNLLGDAVRDAWDPRLRRS